MKNTPHTGKFIVSSSAAMYLKKEEMFKSHSQNYNSVFYSIHFYYRTAVSAGGHV